MGKPFVIDFNSSLDTANCVRDLLSACCRYARVGSTLRTAGCILVFHRTDCSSLGKESGRMLAEIKVSASRLGDRGIGLRPAVAQATDHVDEHSNFFEKCTSLIRVGWHSTRRTFHRLGPIGMSACDSKRALQSAHERQNFAPKDFARLRPEPYHRHTA
jgi:hypothetical protein